MVAQPTPRVTPQEYLKLERDAEFKSEYFRGYILNMAGASPQHDIISGNVFSSLHVQLRGKPCTPYTSNMRMGVRTAEMYFYPDAAVVCGEPTFDDEWSDTILNTTVIFEVLSKSTERFDRGEKSAAYRALPSLKELVLISQHQPTAERYTRQPDNTWLFTEVASIDGTLELPSIDCRIPMADIYERIDFPPPTPPEIDPRIPR